MNLKKTICTGMIACAVTCQAAGFSILEQSATGLGHALAGMTAETTDPASIYFNPATATGAERPELSLGNHIMYVHCNIHDKGSDTSLGGDESNNLGGWVTIPNIYYVRPISSTVSIGFGLSATSGTSTSYNPYWLGRYGATDTEIAVMDFTSVLAWKIRDDLSIGVGLVIERADMYMEQMIPLKNYVPGHKDGKLELSGDAVSFGFSTGILYEPLPGTQIGLGYRSRISHDIDLDCKVKNAGDLGMRTSSDGDTTLKLPQVVNLGIKQKINDKWNVMMDISWSEWSIMDELKVKLDKPVMGSSGSTQEMKWDDNWRFSIGADYKVTDKLTWRVGTTYDMTPVQDEYRNLKLPDADRYWLCTGFGYQINENVRCDLAYTHIFMHSVSFTEETSGGTVKAKATGRAEILSMSLTYLF